ncbi:MAG: aminomethyl transferase family protein [Coriobacteriia bacterium]|nr:aminomethyl transferase family protein [Coriobacteriia bacterium]
MPDQPNTFQMVSYTPQYDDVRLYQARMGSMMAVWEGDGWKQESMSWKESCYIHAGISGGVFQITGPDAQAMLSYASINDVYKWPIGTHKHLVMCNADGLIEAHTLTLRAGEETFRYYAGNPWPLFRQVGTGKFNVQIEPIDMFVYQIAGPLSLTVIEKIAQQSFRDVSFLDCKMIRLPGIEPEIELARIGMTGNLAYELRGPAAVGHQVYDMAYQAGKPLGMKRLGWRTYCVNHVEGGFPQITVTFTVASVLDPVFGANLEMAAAGMMPYTGSVDPSDIRARLRTPGEVGWMWMARFDHDFLGREAVQAESENPQRKVVNLVWNVEDIMDITASQYQPGEEYKNLEYPCGVPQPAGGHADLVTTLDGRPIGISSGTTYSYYYREEISQCIIDIDQAIIGNEVLVHWGDFGGRIKEVRAKVARYPYIDLLRNENDDLGEVPSGV